MFQIYTSYINTFVQKYCVNNIFTTDQAGGKQGVCECLGQRLINKIVLNELNKIVEI